MNGPACSLRRAAVKAMPAARAARAPVGAALTATRLRLFYLSFPASAGLHASAELGVLRDERPGGSRPDRSTPEPGWTVKRPQAATRAPRLGHPEERPKPIHFQMFGTPLVP